jgi:hypothetical protein
MIVKYMGENNAAYLSTPSDDLSNFILPILKKKVAGITQKFENLFMTQ